MMETNQISNKNEIKTLPLLVNIEGLDLRHRDCCFGNYDVDKENKTQYEACKSWNFKESITFTGKTGTGKTHLAIAMLKSMPKVKYSDQSNQETKEQLEYDIRTEAVRHDRFGNKYGKEHYQKVLDSGSYMFRKARVLIVPVVKMFIELNSSAMTDKGKMEQLEKYAGTQYDCICFDDFGSEKLTDAKRENFYYIVDTRYRDMLPTIITSNFTIQEINENEPRIASRFSEMGKILQFSGKDYRLKK